MILRKIIDKSFRTRRSRANVAAEIRGVISASVGESGSGAHVSSRSRHRVVQRGARTIVDEHEHETGERSEDDRSKGGI